jgi:hypothetical protein
MAATPLSKLIDILKAGEAGMPLLPAEAAAFLRCEVGTLAVWRSKRKGPKYILCGTTPQYLLSDLKAYLLEAKPRKQVSPNVGRPPKKRARA